MKRRRAAARLASVAPATALPEVVSPEAMYAALPERFNIDKDWRSGVAVLPYPDQDDLDGLMTGIARGGPATAFAAEVLWRYARHLAARAHHTGRCSEAVRLATDRLYDTPGAPETFPEAPPVGAPADRCLAALAGLARLVREAGKGDARALEVLSGKPSAAREVCVAFIEATGLRVSA